MDCINLADIHTKYSTDKGTEHNYINVYDTLFKKYQCLDNINFLEIGIFTGGSLKMFHEYFQKAIIYGVDPFIRNDNDALSQEFLKDGATCIEDRLLKDLQQYDRMKVIKGFSQKVSFQDGLKFSIVIDDGDHSPQAQLDTFTNIEKYLTDDGIYIIEDVINQTVTNNLINILKTRYAGKWSFVPLFLNIKHRADDILIIARRINNRL